jgi:putative chitinase
MITVAQLGGITPLCKDKQKWTDELNYHLGLHGIVSLEQVACFIAQTAHESGQFNIVEENLNYSAQGLVTTFSKYFDTATANSYARKPQAIANRVYANRMGNGIESSGDGWKFRGRGILQVTGKENYSKFSMDLFNDDRFVKSPDDLTQPEMAMRSALWFWDKNNLSNITDMTLLTRKINGGMNGLQSRIDLYNIALSVL